MASWADIISEEAEKYLAAVDQVREETGHDPKWLTESECGVPGCIHYYEEQAA
jgi:hypothetical protein